MHNRLCQRSRWEGEEYEYYTVGMPCIATTTESPVQYLVIVSNGFPGVFDISVAVKVWTT